MTRRVEGPLLGPAAGKCEPFCLPITERPPGGTPLPTTGAAAPDSEARP